MALPAGVSLVTVTLGPFLDFQGNALGGQTVFTPSSAVLHTATGTPVLNKPIVVPWGVLGTATVQLPATDDPSLTPINFLYSVQHSFEDRSIPTPPVVPIQLPRSVPTVDLDLLIPASGTSGVTVNLPAVQSVAGYSGTVTGAQLAADPTVRAALLPFWVAGEAVKANDRRVNPDGQIIRRIADGTTGLSYDATEAALWAIVGGASTGGGRTSFDFDARDYSLPMNGTSDAATALQAAMDAASAAASSSGRQQALFLPPGTFKNATHLLAKPGVRLVGAGEAVTVLRPQGAVSGIKGPNTSTAQLLDFHGERFTIDGVDQTGTSTQTKGMYIQYAKGLRLRHVTIKNSIATAFGNDFLQQYRFENCRADNAGRGGSGATGFSGFGIGTGFYAVEDGQVVDCVSEGAFNYGFFWEKQAGTATYRSTGHKAVGCRAFGGKFGFADVGVDRLRVSDFEAIGQSFYGIKTDTTFDTANPGIDGTFSDGLITGAAQGGIYVIKAGAGYTFEDIRVIDCRKNAFRVDDPTASHLSLINFRAKKCDNAGVYIAPAAAGITDFYMHGGLIRANGQRTDQTPRAAVHFGGAVTRPIIEGVTTGDYETTKRQTYGLQLATGVTLTDPTFRYNDFRGNLTGAVDVASGTLSGDVSGIHHNEGWTYP